ncbi:MAG: CoA transferase [Ruminococcaceae bacterium]|nr:CoA transferase [Oscillospiraceae bacterium]
MSAAFEGVRVLDFTINLAGPSASAILADLGADVIKIERPITGDDARAFGPFVGGESITSLWLSRGKRSVEIDLADPEGRALIQKLLPTATVVIESFRPGVMKKHGLDYESVKAVKPDIIYCSVSANGQTGPYAPKPGYDLQAQGMSGLLDMTGEPDGPPQRSGTVLGDYVGGLNAWGAIATALYHHAKTGQGQHLDISLYEGLVMLNSMVDYVDLDLKPTRTGNHHPNAAPYGIFNGHGGQSAIICAPSDRLWNKLCDAMQKPQLKTDARFNNAPARMDNLPGVIDAIEGFLKHYDDIDVPIKILEDAGIPCCKSVSSHQVLEDAHLVARGSVVQLEGTAEMKENGVQGIRMRGPWVKYSQTPAVMRASGGLGQHNREILNEAGLSDDQADALEAKWHAKK